ncbi:MAG: endo-1,4-beta-xylanase, partial [Bacteroidota bacterium]
AWVFEDEQGNPASRELLIDRMRDHIETVVGRYRGRVDGWDVVNEALNEDGSLRQSPWYRIIGEEYLALAFQFAHEADPDAELYYNDYSLENEPKRRGAVRLVQNLLDQGIPVHGIGSQLHARMDWPSQERLDSTIVEFADLGIDVMFTELDIDLLPRDAQYYGADISVDMELRAELNPYEDGLPEDVEQEQAARYGDLFEVFLRHADVISRVTFWGVTDGDSWLNYWPVQGRTNYPLIFDRNHEPKLAFDAVVEAARSASN